MLQQHSKWKRHNINHFGLYVNHFGLYWRNTTTQYSYSNLLDTAKNVGTLAALDLRHTDKKNSAIKQNHCWHTIHQRLKMNRHLQRWRRERETERQTEKKTFLKMNITKRIPKHHCVTNDYPKHYFVIFGLNNLNIVIRYYEIYF